MDLSPAHSWQPPEHWQRFEVIDSHTGGEPFRVVLSGLPEIPGDTVLERRSYAETNLDDLRRALMWEPRGHADMYGCWIGPPMSPDSHLSVLFVHNEGFSTMCGHGIIALGKVLVDTGVAVKDPTGETTLRIDTPAGLVVATANSGDDGVESVRFRNVVSFAPLLGGVVDVEGLGPVSFDVGFGGAFYAYVDAESVGLALDDVPELVSKGRAIKDAVSALNVTTHPTETDLGFLYGVIFTGHAELADNHSRNVCVFADGEIDRSPTGTGVSGRLAILHARGEIGPDDPITIESIVGSAFEGRIVDEGAVGDRPGVIPEISGSAHIIGRSSLWIDPSDPLNPGFFLR
jgi:trans-L-3-hydroxyproline dehydratase